jgi:hypothetical protein
MGGWCWSRHENVRNQELEESRSQQRQVTQLKEAKVHRGYRADGDDDDDMHWQYLTGRKFPSAETWSAVYFSSSFNVTVQFIYLELKNHLLFPWSLKLLTIATRQKAVHPLIRLRFSLHHHSLVSTMLLLDERRNSRGNKRIMIILTVCRQNICMLLTVRTWRLFWILLR